LNFESCQAISSSYLRTNVTSEQGALLSRTANKFLPL